MMNLAFLIIIQINSLAEADEYQKRAMTKTVGPGAKT